MDNVMKPFNAPDKSSLQKYWEDVVGGLAVDVPMTEIPSGQEQSELLNGYLHNGWRIESFQRLPDEQLIRVRIRRNTTKESR